MNFPLLKNNFSFARCPSGITEQNSNALNSTQQMWTCYSSPMLDNKRSVQLCATVEEHLISGTPSQHLERNDKMGVVRSRTAKTKRNEAKMEQNSAPDDDSLGGPEPGDYFR